MSHYDGRHQLVDSRHQNAWVCPSVCTLATQHLRRKGSEDTLAFLVCTREGVIEAVRAAISVSGVHTRVPPSVDMTCVPV